MLQSNWPGRGALVAVVCVLVSAGSAWAGLLASDDFGDNARATGLWDEHTVLAGSILETNQRLEYTSAGGGVADVDNIGAYQLAQPLPYGQAWSVTLDVTVEAYPAAPLSACYGMEFTVINSDDPNDILWLTLDRGEDSPSSFWSLFSEADGVETNDQSHHNDADSGTMRLAWDGANFMASYDEGSGWQEFAPIDVDDWGMGAGDAFTFFVGGYDNNCDFALDEGARMYADNFTLVPEPATLSLLALGGVAMLRRRRRGSR